MQGAAALSDVGRAGMALLLESGNELEGRSRALGRKGAALGFQLPTLPPVAVTKSAKDPYISFAKETDYFEVRWKKGE